MILCKAITTRARDSVWLPTVAPSYSIENTGKISIFSSVGIVLHGRIIQMCVSFSYHYPSFLFTILTPRVGDLGTYCSNIAKMFKRVFGWSKAQISSQGWINNQARTIRDPKNQRFSVWTFVFITATAKLSMEIIRALRQVFYTMYSWSHFIYCWSDVGSGSDGCGIGAQSSFNPPQPTVYSDDQNHLI